MKWGKTDTTKMDNNHLKNTINWIKKQLLLIPTDLKYYLYKEIAISFRYAQIACIEAELEFRITGINKRTISEIIYSNIEKIFDFYQKNETMFRINNWKTNKEIQIEMRIDSDRHFEDNFGHSPYYENWDNDDLHDNQYTN